MKTPKIFKITLAAMLGLTAFGAGMYALNNDFTVQAEENTESVRVDTSAFERIENAEYLRYQIVMGLTPNYKTRIYPDGYNLTDHDNILDSKTPFIGTYILTGDNSDGTLFFYGNEDGTPQEYNVILHDFIAVGDVYNPVVLQIGKNVTLNISVYGVNQIQGYDMPAIERMDLEGLEELTLDEKEALSGYASVNFRAMDKSKLVLGIDNTSGSRSQYGIDEKVWNASNEQYEDIGDSHRFGRTIAKGVATDAHEIKYQAREDGLSCEAYCDECDVVFADFTHEWTPDNDGKAHTMVCLDCGTVKNAEHNIENGVCVDCNVNIRVTIGAEETYYASFADALEATSGQESAEIKLLGNVEGVAEWVRTRLTLDLNGFTMSNTALHISDAVEGASLIIKDTSEAQTGTVKGRSGYGWGLYNGKNEIQGGYFDENVVFYMDYNAIELKISGGHFEGLDVGIKNSSSVIIDGATANEVHFSGYGDGSLEVKSLSFQYWWQDSDDNEGAFIHSISDCLADGYKIIDENGAFVDFGGETLGLLDWDSETGEYIYYNTFTVVDHSTCTNELQSDETHHWYACACGATEDGSEIVKEEHTGGTATCQTLAVCDVCGNKYGETADHVASETWEKDDTHHWHLCVGDETCEEILDKAEHACGEWTVTKEATQEEKGEKTRSCECGYTETEDIDVLPPDEDTASDTTSDTDSDVSDTTSDTDNDVSDTTSDTASSTPNDTTDDVPAKEGCGSVVGGGTALLMIGAAAVVLAIRKRKED